MEELKRTLLALPLSSCLIHRAVTSRIDKCMLALFCVDKDSVLGAQRTLQMLCRMKYLHVDRLFPIGTLTYKRRSPASGIRCERTCDTYTYQMDT